MNLEIYSQNVNQLIFDMNGKTNSFDSIKEEVVKEEIFDNGPDDNNAELTIKTEQDFIKEEPFFSTSFNEAPVKEETVFSTSSDELAPIKEEEKFSTLSVELDFVEEEKSFCTSPDEIYWGRFPSWTRHYHFVTEKPVSEIIEPITNHLLLNDVHTSETDRSKPTSYTRHQHFVTEKPVSEIKEPITNHLLLNDVHSSETNQSIPTSFMNCVAACSSTIGNEDWEKYCKCGLCNRRYLGASMFLVHLISHSEESPLVCHICRRKFTQKSELNNHLMLHSSRFSVSRSVSMLKQERDKLSFSEARFTCTSCGEEFTETSEFNVHSLLHLNKGPFICPRCNNDFASKSNLKKHLLWYCKESKGQKSFCQDSSMRLEFQSDKYPLELPEERELRLSHSMYSKGEVATCGVCEIKYANKSLLEQHYIYHLIRPPLNCPLCKSKSTKVAYLISHFRNHAKIIGSYPKCHLIFLLKRELEEHFSNPDNNNEDPAKNFIPIIFKKILREFWYRQSILKVASPIVLT